MLGVASGGDARRSDDAVRGSRRGRARNTWGRGRAGAQFNRPFRLTLVPAGFHRSRSAVRSSFPWFNHVVQCIARPPPTRRTAGTEVEAPAPSPRTDDGEGGRRGLGNHHVTCRTVAVVGLAALYFVLRLRVADHEQQSFLGILVTQAVGAMTVEMEMERSSQQQQQQQQQLAVVVVLLQAQGFGQAEPPRALRRRRSYHHQVFRRQQPMKIVEA